LKLNVDNSWTLFLDRDGVINKKRDNDYVKCWEEFEFIDGAIDAISTFSNLFGRIIIVTNQRGVGKGLMTENELNLIHIKMLDDLNSKSGKISKVYYCVDLSEKSEFRKPNLGMALAAKSDFPEIDFAKSIMVGDSISDMQFGNSLGMKCIYISTSNIKSDVFSATYFGSLYSFCISLIQ
jgi:D-glycero-D-manno-heptose 1,7-bisphosphate phosphatase